MKALIDPNASVTLEGGRDGQRVCQCETTVFDVREPLFWTDCPEDLEPALYGWDNSQNKFVSLAVEESVPESAESEEQPTYGYIGTHLVTINGEVQPGVVIENDKIVSIDGKPIAEILAEMNQE